MPHGTNVKYKTVSLNKRKVQKRHTSPSPTALPVREFRLYQQIFRVTGTELRELRRKAIKAKCTSMSVFYRRKLGLKD